MPKVLENNFTPKLKNVPYSFSLHYTFERKKINKQEKQFACSVIYALININEDKYISFFDDFEKRTFLFVICSRKRKSNIWRLRHISMKHSFVNVKY